MSACGRNQAAKVTATGMSTMSAMTEATMCQPLMRENAKTPGAGVLELAVKVGGEWGIPPWVDSLFVTDTIHQFYGCRLQSTGFAHIQ